MKPSTQYTKSGRINIAYQVFGSGTIDLVYIPGWVSNIDWMWACPELVHFLYELGKICRVILFDKRGTGLSDRVVELSTLEERMDDLRAVMDAVGAEKAILFGHSEGGSVSALFAATYPNRTISLITFGVFAKRRYAPDYPWAPTDEQRQQVYDMIENSWGGGEMNLETLAPSKAKDPIFMDWLANYLRSGASPSAALVLTKTNTEVDIVDILGSIKVPTLMMQRTNDVDVKIEEGRFIAQRIAGARFVEFDGDDHLFWAGNTEEVLNEMKAFILNVKPRPNYERQLFTIMAGRILSSNKGDNELLQLINRLVVQYRGKVIRFNQDTFIASFQGPSKAVHCGIALIDTFESLDLKVCVGVHIKEMPVDQAHFISNETGSFVTSMLKQAGPSQILITQTVKHLLSGAGLNFAQHNTVFETTTANHLLLYSVTDQLNYQNEYTSQPTLARQNDSFLENILQCIESHMSNEKFGVDMLCKEVGISERQLQRKLKSITNKSPNQMISSVRLHKAKELILSNHEGIAEVAFQTGFASPSYFSKCFKREFGHSPSDLLS
ncbi:alpha/beta fold hydrolase [Marinoscillum sp. 108]|uniref:alpha/beta fold hydrolase n=1 Tax=Marinoscillum sp. 108 TaxID=2653151 RepID=UPI0012EF6C6C|nr:alpha/beta fold hydrolase [Marinoscillum sp. 108]VXD11859.1 Adenylate/guanylate cyclase domain-containing protein [Marinoscillum sp. 108]